MSKWFMIVDVAKCCNCQNCTLATKDEFVGNDYTGYSAAQPLIGHEWLTIDRHIRGSGTMIDVTYVPRMCNHCDNAPCIKAGAGAVYKRSDGIVIIDPVKAKGKKNIVSSCPYHAIWWNDELGLPQHWIFDAHLLDQGWKEPRCAQACPTEALRALKVSDDEMATLVKEQDLSVIEAGLHSTKPRVYYRNLDRVNRQFIGGNVVLTSVAGCVDNVEGAVVDLASADRTVILRSQTDRFGDFKFVGLEGAGKKYNVKVNYKQYEEIVLDIALTESRYLGSIDLRQPSAGPMSNRVSTEF